ncbi:hypothetical protein [Sphingobium cloacae]|uniref:Uncharacterized protein n=2 Tax=Sphingobium cloacae TaxID=120107 RepID=A0A1E1EZN5_9SPHN|nr:hypothetical protein [Sphingobium cloacae]BAV63738.1 hypothetical protein SCLO_1006980 [Sphingobium cloacae]
MQAGLLTTLKGEPGTASTYRATEKLYSVAEGHGVTEQSLTLRLPPERLVRLRRGNFETPLLDFEPTANTNHWAVLLEAYNGFLAQQDIALDLSADEQTEWVKRLNKDRKRTDPRICRPELIQTDLYRQFCHASFEQGGRLYGGWWINAPKDLRKKITINGEPVAECDYSGCAIRMLYHENRIEYTDDPYWIGIVSDCEKAEGLPPGYFREGLKAITQTLLNGDMENRPENARISFSFKPYFSRPQVRKMLLEKHTPIASAFGSRAGLRLQRKDSDLALSIITDLREQGIVALPIHDSFLVPQKDKENLIKSMNYHYKEMIGFNPIIK